MAQFKAKQNKATEHFAKCERLRAQGRHDLIKPLEASRSDHQRAGDAYREHKRNKGPNGKAWKGVKGKEKLTRGPQSPRI